MWEGEIPTSTIQLFSWILLIDNGSPELQQQSNESGFSDIEFSHSFFFRQAGCPSRVVYCTSLELIEWGYRILSLSF